MAHLPMAVSPGRSVYRIWSEPASAALPHFVRACGAQDPFAQQLEAGSAIHLALEHLEPVNLALRLTAAPRLLQSGTDGGVVSAESLGERRQRRDLARAARAQPLVEVAETFLADHPVVRAREVVQACHLGVLPDVGEHARF